MKSSMTASASWRVVAAPGVRLITRHGDDFTSRFPLAVAAVTALPAHSFLIDGEAIVTNGDGLVDGFHPKEGWSYDRQFICAECVTARFAIAPFDSFVIAKAASTSISEKALNRGSCRPPIPSPFPDLSLWWCCGRVCAARLVVR